jgi:hypothetical protein
VSHRPRRAAKPASRPARPAASPTATGDEIRPTFYASSPFLAGAHIELDALTRRVVNPDPRIAEKCTNTSSSSSHEMKAVALLLVENLTVPRQRFTPSVQRDGANDQASPLWFWKFSHVADLRFWLLPSTEWVLVQARSRRVS